MDPQCRDDDWAKTLLGGGGEMAGSFVWMGDL